MSGEDNNVKKMVQQAAGIIAAVEGKIKIVESMKIVGFSTPQRKNMTTYQQVRRKAARLVVVEKKPSSLNLDSAESNVSTLTSSEETHRRAGRNSSVSSSRSNSTAGNPEATSVARTTATDNQRRSNSQYSPNTLATMLSSKAAEKTPAKASKKMRRSSREVQRQQAALARQSKRNKQAMKEATRQIYTNSLLPADHPQKRTIVTIVDNINGRMKSNVSDKTAADYVRKGMVGTSPLKRGPDGSIPKRMYTSLKHSFTTYLKLEQAESKKQSTIQQMSRLVNACVNRAGHNKNRDDLTRKLKRETADEFSVGKANVVENRRLRWTTAYNLEVWFNTWRDTLIELGFAREPLPGEEVEGELVFHEDQRRRIINLDETDGSLDDTTGQRGGRPPMTFMAGDVSGGGTSVNKSGYSATVICGSNAAGEPLPPHFQLKTLAQEANQRMQVDWIANSKDVLAQFGFPERRRLPCTFGMNEKAGMNAVELDKYFHKAIIPLYPDVEDIVGKRVIVNVDSGPGRMNIDLLANLQLRGLYMVPLVPNTTGTTQVTDQNYGQYKSGFRGNLRSLSQARFDKGLSLRVTDLPLLVFGGTCSKTNVVLCDAFSDSFSLERNLSCWQKCGAVPLTRAPIKRCEARFEVPTGDAAGVAAAQGVTEDEGIAHLRNIEAANHFHCDFLSANGYDGSQLRRDAPKRTTYVAVTQPHSQARVEAIRKAKTAGQMFFVTGGGHLNSDEFFKARALAEREEEIKVMEEKKKARGKYCAEQKGAVMLLRSKGELTFETEKVFTLPEIKTLLKWKKIKPPSSRKRDMVEAYIAAPKPKIQKVWCRSEEAALEALKNRDVDLKDTALGVATNQMARAVTKNLAKMDASALEELRKGIEDYDNSDGPNVI